MPPTAAHSNIGGMDQQQSTHLPKSGQTPPPPGLLSSTPSASPGLPPGPSVGTSRDPPLGPDYDRGVAFRVADGAVSAPPPPGFGAAPDQRDRTLSLDVVRGLLDERAVIPGDRQQQDALLRPSAISEVTSDGAKHFVVAGAGTIGYDGEDQPNGKRTSSFANLAAALGEGLAESMDDSLLQRQRQQQEQDAAYPPRIPERANAATQLQGSGSDQSTEDLYHRYQQPPTSLSSRCSGHSAGNGSDMDNFDRQSRHMATRLVGSSTSSSREELGLRFSTSTGTAVMPARLLASSRDRVGQSPAAGDIEEKAPASVPMMIAPLQSSQGMPLEMYSQSASSNPALIGRTPVGVTVVEPGSRTNSPHLPNIAMQGQTLKPHHAVLPSSCGNEMGTHYSGEGRSSAPPKVSVGGTTSLRRAADVGEVGHQVREKQQSPGAEVLRSSPVPGNPAPASAHPSYSSTYTQPHTAHPECISMLQAEEELSPFLWSAADDVGGGAGSPASSRTPSPMNKTGRGLAILHAANLFIPDVRSTCEAFGALMSFRHEFCKNRGVIFITYHDLRSARHAAVELRACLKRLATPHSAISHSGHDDVQVRYCVPLNASSHNDESIVVVSNMPRSFDEQRLKVIMASYGAVRGVRFDALGEYSDEAHQSYMVEFYDVQDAKQALLELESTQPWGIEVTVTVGKRHPSERKLGQELLALINRWRRGEQTGEPSANIVLAPGPSPSPLPLSEAYPGSAQRSGTPASIGSDTGLTVPNNPHKSASPEASSTSTSPMPRAPDVSTTNGVSPHIQGSRPQPTTQLVVGPDGQYSYIVMNQPLPHVMPPHQSHPQAGQTIVSGHHPVQQVIHGPHGAYVASYPTSVASYHEQPQYLVHHHPHIGHMPQYHHIPGATVISTSPYGYPPTVPVYAPVGTSGAQIDSSASSTGSSNAGAHHSQGHHQVDGNTPTSGRRGGNSSSHRSHGQSTASRTSSGDEDTAQLALDITAVESGTDTRTSLMVRNIPNKYTQRMLLSEFAEGGHGSDKMDFFYLPIDFKNKCNRGYAFVNFVDYRSIVAFYHRYNGKHWKVFNSDKICQITYARIQGKTSMLKRFQNSALMEKDEEYKPLVFVSHGADKGQREDFPPATHPQPALSSLAEAAAPKEPQSSS